MNNTNSAGQEEKIKVGTSIIRNLSNSFYPNKAMIFEELVTNARDAMAENVEIEIKDDKITIKDDGEGMTPSQLSKFFFISYSEKSTTPVKTYKDIRREIIGKFGLGKLSLYQICRSFTIESWRDAKISRATFDFDAFEKNQFIDDFNLNVNIESSSLKSSGTRIILINLRSENLPKTKDIINRLRLSMPLDKKFKVKIYSNGSAPYLLKASKLPKGTEYVIDTDKDEWKNFNYPEIGRITGKIVYKPTEKREGGDFGVYVRVFRRIVNADNPHGIINFSSLTHARQFARKVYADLNADGLVDALLTNRSGFMANDKKFVLFQEVLKKLLNHLNDKENKRWEKFKISMEKQLITSDVACIVQEMINDPSLSGIAKEFSGLEIDLEDKPKSSEPISWKGKKKITINSAHPLYSSARKKGKEWGIKFYSSMIILIEIALKTSKDLADFRRILYMLMSGEPADYIRKKEVQKRRPKNDHKPKMQWKKLNK